MARIERSAVSGLFLGRRYPWTGTTSLGAHLVSATCSHYDCAQRRIREGLGRRGRAGQKA